METYYEIDKEYYNLNEALLKCTESIGGVCALENLPCDTDMAKKIRAVGLEAIMPSMEVKSETFDKIWAGIKKLIKFIGETIVAFFKWLYKKLQAEMREWDDEIKRSESLIGVNVLTDETKLKRPFPMFRTNKKVLSGDDLLEMIQDGRSTFDLMIYIDQQVQNAMGVIIKVVKAFDGKRAKGAEIIAFNKAIGNARYGTYTHLVDHVTKKVKPTLLAANKYGLGHMYHGKGPTLEVLTIAGAGVVHRMLLKYEVLDAKDFTKVKKIKTLNSVEMQGLLDVCTAENKYLIKWGDVKNSIVSSLNQYVVAVDRINKDLGDNPDITSYQKESIKSLLSYVLVFIKMSDRPVTETVNGYLSLLGQVRSALKDSRATLEKDKLKQK